MSSPIPYLTVMLNQKTIVIVNYFSWPLFSYISPGGSCSVGNFPGGNFRVVVVRVTIAFQKLYSGPATAYWVSVFKAFGETETVQWVLKLHLAVLPPRNHTVKALFSTNSVLR